MNINRDNYEKFFLDYLEGALQDPLLSRFRQFLDENPDLATELSDIAGLRLTPGPEAGFPKKDALKKKPVSVDGIDESNIDQLLVASLEGDLGAGMQQKLDEFLELNPAYRHDLKLFHYTRLQPGLDEVYPAREKLKHRPLLFLPHTYTRTGAIAAALILLFFGWRALFHQPAQPPGHQELQFARENPSAREAIPARLTAIKAEPVVYAMKATAHLPVVAALPAEYNRPSPIILAMLEPGNITTRGNPALLLKQTPNTELFAGLFDTGKDQDSRSMVGKILANLGGKARERGQAIKNLAAPRDKKVDFWDLADIGVRGFNKLADRNVEIEVVRNESGNMVHYSFQEEERVILSKNLKQQ